jgi:ABC-type lipoprotein export system ATPase subunit
VAAAISMRNVVKRYGSGSAFPNEAVLENFNLEIKIREFVALIGRSGVGKTTILNLIGGLDQPNRGEVVVGNTTLNRLSTRQLAHWRAHQVGFGLLRLGLA